MYEQPTASRGPANGAAGRASIQVAGLVTPLDELDKSLEAAHVHIGNLIDRARGIADGLIGPEPEGSKDGQTMPRSGRLGALNGRAEYICASLVELERQINRINQIG